MSRQPVQAAKLHRLLVRQGRERGGRQWTRRQVRELAAACFVAPAPAAPAVDEDQARRIQKLEDALYVAKREVARLKGLL